jgi:hypothetical protein
MFGLDQVQLALILLLFVIIWLGVRRRRTKRGVAQVHIKLYLFTPIGIQVRAHDLIEAGRFADAVKLISEESEISQPEAEEVARALRAGHVLPDLPMLEKEDLPVRVRDLVADDRRKEAVFLVRIEEKMRQRAAEAFVDSVTPGPHA